MVFSVREVNKWNNCFETDVSASFTWPDWQETLYFTHTLPIECWNILLSENIFSSITSIHFGVESYIYTYICIDEFVKLLV